MIQKIKIPLFIIILIIVIFLFLILWQEGIIFNNDKTQENVSITFEKNNTAQYLQVDQFTPDDLIWEDINIYTGYATLPKGKVKKGDIISNCTTSVALMYIPSNTILGQWNFTVEYTDVIVTTSKDEYTPSERIDIKIKNPMTETIAIVDVYHGIELYADDSWVNLWEYTGYNCSCGIFCTFGDFPELAPQKNITFYWDQEVWDHCNDNPISMPTPQGLYRIKTQILYNNDTPTSERQEHNVYSNEFLIHEN